MREIYYYLRDKMNRPVVTVCLLVNETAMARGIAVCSVRDQPYKKKGRNIARARAAYGLSLGVTSTDAEALPVYRREAFDAINRVECYPKYFLGKKSWLNPSLTEFEKELLQEQRKEAA
jgi:hypothetical protein